MRTHDARMVEHLEDGLDFCTKIRSGPSASPMPNALIAIVPCSNLDASEAFYERLGFRRHDSDSGNYRILANDGGGELHLTAALGGWLVAGRNPFGLYFYTEGVDELATRLGQTPEDKPWGMYEFAVSDPDQTLVRVGWPSRLRTPQSR